MSKSKEFTKADLKDGMIVETRLGERKLVLGSQLVGARTYGDLSNYAETLLHKDTFYSDLDILKVYDHSPYYTFYDILHGCCLTLLWERPEVKEVTMAEIEEKFGCRVKIVKERESR